MSPPVGAGPPYSLQALSTEAISTTFATGSWSQHPMQTSIYNLDITICFLEHK